MLSFNRNALDSHFDGNDTVITVVITTLEQGVMWFANASTYGTAYIADGLMYLEMSGTESPGEVEKLTVSIGEGLELISGFDGEDVVLTEWNGCTIEPYYPENYDRESEGYDGEGYNIEGFDRDSEGYDGEGYNIEGFDRDGVDREGYYADGSHFMEDSVEEVDEVKEDMWECVQLKVTGDKWTTRAQEVIGFFTNTNGTFESGVVTMFRDYDGTCHVRHCEYSLMVKWYGMERCVGIFINEGNTVKHIAKCFTEAEARLMREDNEIIDLSSVPLVDEKVVERALEYQWAEERAHWAKCLINRMPTYSEFVFTVLADDGDWVVESGGMDYMQGITSAEEVYVSREDTIEDIICSLVVARNRILNSIDERLDAGLLW